MEISAKLKRGIAVLLAAAMLTVFFAACDSADENNVSSSSQAPENISLKEADDLTTGNEPIAYDISEDTTTAPYAEPVLNGEFVYLTEKAEEVIYEIDIAPVLMMDMDDGVMCVYLTSSDDGVLRAVFSHVTSEGKEKLRSTYELMGNNQRYYVADVRNEAGIDGDVVLKTSAGLHVFKLDALDSAYTLVEPSDEIWERIGSPYIATQDNVEYSVFYQSFDIYIPDNKIVFIDQEGVYVANLDGSGERKLVDQPEPQAWFANHEEYSDLGEVEAIYANPRLINNGKTLICDIVNYDKDPSLNEDFVGFIFIDVETGEAVIQGLHDTDSIFSNLGDYEEVTHDRSYVVLNDTQIGIANHGLEGTNHRRLDYVYDCVTNEVVKFTVSPTGITRDFSVLGVSDSYIGASGVISIYDMDGGDYLDDYAIKVTNADAVNTFVAMSNNYGLTLVSGTGDYSGIYFRILVPLK